MPFFKIKNKIIYALEFDIEALGQLEITSDNETISWGCCLLHPLILLSNLQNFKKSSSRNV